MKTFRCKVIADYRAAYPDSIVFNKGDSITVGKEFGEDPEWKNWYWCEAEDGQKAWIPEQYIVTQGNRGVLIKDYDAKELSIHVGETVTIYEIINGFGLAENVDGEKGWVPERNLCGIRQSELS